jgi:hypothetical protein
MYDGNVTSFDTKMTWYNSSGTNAHTHDLTNFKASSGNTQALPSNNTNKQTIVEGFTDIDFDGVEDSKDNCPTVKNPDQSNTNGDDLGDAYQMSDQRSRRNCGFQRQL